ncbi:type II secretion system F family protein [Ferrimonas balearica]|nr:type II secretion system F family protein [Ferrimonas balearica]
MADGRADAAQKLKTKGLFAAELHARTDGGERRSESTANQPSVAGGAQHPGTASRPGRGWRPPRRAAMSSEERTIFTRQLEVLLSADVPVDMALETVAGSGVTQRMEAVAVATRAALHEGADLADAMAQADPGLPPYYLAAIASGERSGELARVVAELAQHLEVLSSDRSRIATALIYPVFVAIVSLLVCAILMTTVAPQLVSMFEASGQPLPPITRVLLAITGWFSRNWPWLGGGLAGLVLVAVPVLRRPAARQARKRMLLRLPLVGGLMRNAAAQQYLQTLALLLSSRQTALDAVESASRVLTLTHFRDQSAAAADAIRRGETLSSALQQAEFIPPVCRQLIAAGESSARVGKMTDRAARLVESWLENDRKRIAAAIEPLLMMLIGGFVLIVVLAVLLPIFDMQSMVTAG